jgi:isoquinoline 1-oxidoreductase
MLYASVLRPPVHGATLARLDTAAAQRLRGVTVVRQDGLVAALHADPEAAAAALAAIQADWTLPAAGPDTEAIFDHLLAHATVTKDVLVRGELARGEPAAGLGGAVKAFDTTFRKGYVAHAPIETHAALAEFEDGRMTVWASTQTPFPARDSVAQALALDPSKVRVITPYVGGGFGGKSSGAQIVEAARLALAVKRPVQVAWTRAEEFFNDSFDPAAVVKTRSGTARDGRIAFWDSTVWAAGERGATPGYDIAHARVRSIGGMAFEGEASRAPPLHPFGTGPWRAPGANMNIFAIESQIDIMAAAAGMDALEFRLLNLADARLRRVLQAAAQAFGWTRAPAPSGRGFGVACSADAGTCVATMAEVKVDRASGKVSVLRIVCAQDMGIVVNPEGARMQAEGGLNMGLGYTLGEELRFRGGDILDRNFDTYALPRFSTVPPRIEVVLVNNDELAPQGGGEPSVTTTGAVIANAVFDAIGVRMLRLPMTPARVRQAIAAAAGG